MPKITPVTKREFIKRLKRLGLEPDDPERGKGDDWIIIDPETNMRYTMPSLKKGEDVLPCYIRGMLRRFGRGREDWFKAAKRKKREKS